MAFDNRTAVVTGAGGNIGRALCKAFGQAGVKVAATDISAENVENTAKLCRDMGYDVRPYQQDITSSESVRQSFQDIMKDFGRIDILVNNAGAWVHRDRGGRRFMETFPEEEWQRIFRINIDGTFRCMQQVIPGMVSRHYGRIINLGSIAGISGLPGNADYAAAKAAVIMLTKTAAMENAKRGITVNSISPGMVAVNQIGPNSGTWLGRNGSADEMARAVLFLADDDAGYITGVDIPVDGGRTIGPHNLDITADDTFIN